MISNIAHIRRWMWQNVKKSCHHLNWLLTSDIQPLTNDIQPLTNDIQPLTNDIQPLTNDIQSLTNDIQPLTKGFLLDRGSKDQRALSPPEVQEVSNQVMLMLII